MKGRQSNEQKRAAPDRRGSRLDRGNPIARRGVRVDRRPARPPAEAPASPAAPLKPPASGGIPVAFLLSDGAVIIDFCGPWEVFQDVMIDGPHGEAFRL